MALAHVQTVKGNSAGASNTASTSGITTTSGNLGIVVAGSWQTTTHNNHTITGTIGGSADGNTWTEVPTISPQDPSVNTRSQMFYCKNMNGGASHVFTTTIGGSAFITFFFMEISGADQTAPYHTGAASTGSSTAAYSGNYVTSVADCILIGGLGTADNTNGGTITAGVLFTIPTNGSQNLFANYVSAIEYKIVNGTGTYAADFTIPSDGWSSIGAAFKAGASGGGGTLTSKVNEVNQALKQASTI